MRNWGYPRTNNFIVTGSPEVVEISEDSSRPNKETSKVTFTENEEVAHEDSEIQNDNQVDILILPEVSEQGDIGKASF